MNLKPNRLYPFILTLSVAVLDQVTKLLIVQYIPLNSVGASFLGGFFRIIHVRNLGAAFSIGNSLSPVLRIIIIIILPCIILLGLIITIIRSDDLEPIQRWALAGIIGGGIGNVVFDRIFRPLGVVDFLDFQFFGIFGLERWPTFNIADTSTVICGIILIGTLTLVSKKSKSEVPSSKNSSTVDSNDTGA